MKQWNRLIFFLFINVLVSACTTLTVLVLWDRTQGSMLTDAIASLSQSSPQSEVTATATLSETPVPAATPAPEVQIHEVQVGDTFESIAATYDVSVGAILAENGYTQSQQLSAGDLVRVPVAVLEIDRVVGVGDLSMERVVVRSRSTGELPLSGWMLEDQSGNVFLFPQMTIYVKDSTVSVYTKAGADTVIDLFWGLDAPVWESGEVVTLRDSAGTERATYQVP